MILSLVSGPPTSADNLHSNLKMKPNFRSNGGRLSFLIDSAQATELADKAAYADYVVFASACEGDLPRELKIWIEGWLTKRGEREGTLVGLMEQHTRPFEIASLKEIYLRHVAHRAGLDYLSHVPSRKSKALPNSLDSYQERARQMTSVLDRDPAQSTTVHTTSNSFLTRLSPRAHLTVNSRGL